MRTLFLFFIVSLAFLTLAAQDIPSGDRVIEEGTSYYLHTVKAGETLYSISKRYQVSLEEVNRVNPTASVGIRHGDVLRIPAGAAAAVTGSSVQNDDVRIVLHKVQRKETLYFISRKYGVTIDEILAYNPGLTQLRKGETIRIPLRGGTPLTGGERPSGSGKVTHWVQPGETLYSISRRYGIPVTTLLEENPGARELKSGMRLTIPAGKRGDPSQGAEEAEYITHTIQSGETLYSLSKKYGVSADDLVVLNPSLDKSFRSGSVIRIPRSRVREVEAVEETRTSMRQHVVTAGETLFSISGKYGIEMGELVSANPALEERPPRTGDTLLIRIPVGSMPPEDTLGGASRHTSDCSVKTSYHDHAEVRIALLLPLMIESNRYLNAGFLSGNQDSEDNDEGESSSRKEGYISFQGSSENFLHFYEGALIAVDSLRQMGINVKLDVFDTEQKSSKVKSLVASGDLDNADVIIGPVFPNEQREISDFAMENKIPVVSPLAASDEVTKTNPVFFQINPPRETVSQKTVEYVVSTYPEGHLVVLQTGSSSAAAVKEAELLRAEISRRGGEGSRSGVTVVDYRKSGFSSLREAMVKGKMNIIIIPSDNEAEVSVAVSNIKNLAREFEVTVIGTNRFPQFDSINPENFHAGNLEFLTPYWPDMHQAVTRSFVQKFRTFYKGEPNQFSMQGYDALFYFAKAYKDFGSDLVNCIPKASAHLVQGSYQFTSGSTGGFINHGLIVVRYTPDFQIVRKR